MSHDSKLTWNNLKEVFGIRKVAEMFERVIAVTGGK